MLPTYRLHGIGWVQYLHMSDQRLEKRGPMHQKAVLGGTGATPACGALLSWHGFSSWRWIEHLCVPLKRVQEGGKLHLAAVSHEPEAV